MRRRHIDARISGHVLALVREARKQRRRTTMQEYIPNSATPIPSPVIQHVDYVEAGMDKEEVILGEGDGEWAEAADAHRRAMADAQAERSAPERPENPDADAILPDNDDPSRGGESGVIPGEDERHHIMDDNPDHGIIREPAPDTSKTKPAPEDDSDPEVRKDEGDGQLNAFGNEAPAHADEQDADPGAPHVDVDDSPDGGDNAGDSPQEDA